MEVGISSPNTEVIAERVQPLLVQVADGCDRAALNVLIRRRVPSSPRSATEECAIVPKSCKRGFALR